VMTFA